MNSPMSSTGASNNKKGNFEVGAAAATTGAK
jgi:hypothetical protein